MHSSLGITAIYLATAFAVVKAQIGAVHPVIQPCGPSSSSTSKTVCVNRYAAVLPYHFFRPDSYNGTTVPFSSTSVPADPSFATLANATFVLYNRTAGLQILGPNPSYEKMFNVSDAVHEAPVWVPGVNKLFLSQLAPPAGFLPQLVVDLNREPPTLSEFLSEPPVYAPNGGSFHGGLVYWGEFFFFFFLFFSLISFFFPDTFENGVCERERVND
jgi:hypothetical protein